MTQAASDKLPRQLVWLADAPLFIDSDHVGRFYDAVARPESRQGAINLEVSQENVAAIQGKLNIESLLAVSGAFLFLSQPFRALGQDGVRRFPRSRGGRTRKVSRRMKGPVLASVSTPIRTYHIAEAVAMAASSGGSVGNLVGRITSTPALRGAVLLSGSKCR